MPDLKILAIDPGSQNNCGWAHSCGEAGAWDLRLKPHESTGVWERILRQEISHVRMVQGLDLLVYEEQNVRGKFSNMHTETVLHSLQAYLESIGLHLGVKVIKVNNNTIKRHARKVTGKPGTWGNSDKELLEGAREKIGKWTKTKDEAVARWLLAYATEQISLNPQWSGSCHGRKKPKQSN